MRRRALLRTAGCVGLAGGLSGCLGTIRGLAGGPIRPSGGQAVLHDAAQHYLGDGYRVGGEKSFRAWLVTESPPSTLFAPTIPEEDRAEFTRAFGETDFDSAFRLVVEARMPVDVRFQLGPWMSDDPRWTGLSAAEIPVAAQDASDIDDPSFDDAEALVSTALLEYEARSFPRRATVELRDESGGTRGQTVARRIDG
ncbi:MAG: hypothetical protein ACQETI_12685 [Halobacteriota archaeon]